ncbi:methyltransferase domain-containing protein [Candidatus Woesearchaeota archaeon]|nr:methyltransferase domain-containing protein [Candidatus Woesearchaeota archaeon]
MENTQILPGTKLADFGVGNGDFAMAASKMVGKNGIVYAIDIKKEALEVLKGKAMLSGARNLDFIRADLENPISTTLKEQSVDYVIIASVLFQIASKENVVREAYRILKPEGKVIFIEWLKQKTLIGPPFNARMSKEDAKSLFEIRGFLFDREFYAGDYHYGMIFKAIS